MNSHKKVDLAVGLFMLLAALALVFLALKVSGLAFSQNWFGDQDYTVNATFSNIGDLKIRSPVRVGGVQIGRVSNITLNKQTYEAVVSMTINGKINNLPTDSSASIAKTSLLGDNYVSLSPGYAKTSLKSGGKIITTYPATSIESLISTFMSGDKK